MTQIIISSTLAENSQNTHVKRMEHSWACVHCYSLVGGVRATRLTQHAASSWRAFELLLLASRHVQNMKRDSVIAPVSVRLLLLTCLTTMLRCSFFSAAAGQNELFVSLHFPAKLEVHIGVSTHTFDYVGTF